METIHISQRQGDVCQETCFGGGNEFIGLPKKDVRITQQVVRFGGKNDLYLLDVGGPDRSIADVDMGASVALSPAELMRRILSPSKFLAQNTEGETIR